jgi:hypothetical protein
LVQPPIQAPFQLGYFESSNACALDSEASVASANVINAR